MDSRYSNYYDNVTTLHPLALAMLLVAGIAVLTVRPRDMLLPMLLLGCLVPAAQRVVIFGLDFMFLRILTMLALARLLAMNSFRKFEWTPLDKLFVAWVVVSILIPTLRTRSIGMLIYQLGSSFDAVGIYLLGRLLIRSLGDLDRYVWALMIVSIVTSGFLLYEYLAGTNPFYIFGQAAKEAIVRDGSVRAKGAFSHQILAGCFFAGMAPLMLARFRNPMHNQLMTIAGLSAVLLAVICCSSSTPILGLGLALIAMGFYVQRYRMKQVRWAAFALIMVTQIAMAKPIYHLIHRAGSLGLGASTSYHRFRLIDEFVKRVFEWGPLGVNGTAHWGTGLHDVTNHFILQGVMGGLLGVSLFVAVCVVAFRQLGQAVWVLKSNPAAQTLIWGLGASLFAHFTMMTATSYFGQILLILYASLGAVGSLTPSKQAVLAARIRPAPEILRNGMGGRIGAPVSG